MTAFATTNHANLHRWAISGAVVVLVHGAIAAAVMTWRNIIVPWQPSGAVVIDLAPAPAAPAEQAALEPAPAQVPPTVSADKPLDKVEEKTAARGEEKAKPSQFEQSPGTAAPLTLAPPESAERENGAAASGGVMHQAVPAAGEGAANLIDTRIGEQPRSRKAGKANDWTKSIMGRPSSTDRPMRSFAGRHPDLGAAGSFARNSIGMLTQDVTGAASAKGLNTAAGLKNAVGIAPMSSDQGMARSVGTTTNAIGITVPIRTNWPKMNMGQHKSIVMLASRAPMAPNATINGTSMIRPGSGTAMIGGPAKTIAGVVNGTGIRLK
jgi:hypothetical protein